ncbi:MAG: hypothetical protein JWR35_2158 [Marmoricola sp.]|jgi:hypothetical protein|nr:hypothetical protein [Marmoricola sp.]
MNPSVVLGIIGSAVIMVVLFEMLRRQRLREKYAVLWFLVAVAALVVAFVPGALRGAADVVGVEVPANLLFFAASMFLMVISLQHSHELSRLEEKTRTLAEELALLRLDVDRARGAENPAPGPADD